MDEPRSEASAESLGGGRSLRGPGPVALAVGFAEAGRRALAVGADGSLRSWDVRNGSPGRSVSCGGDRFRVAAGTRDWGEFAAIHVDDKLGVWDAVTGGEVMSRPITCVSLHHFTHVILAVAADGSTAAYANACRDVQVVNVADSMERASWSIPDGQAVSALALSADGRLLVLGILSRDPRSNVIEVRETATGRPIRRMVGHHATILAVDFSADGRQVFSTGKDRTLRVWDVERGREVSRHGLLAGAGLCLAVSGGEPRVLVGMGYGWSNDSWRIPESYGVQVWDVASGLLLGQFETGGPVRSVAVSPDGRNALCAVADGGVSLWPMPEGEPVRRVAAGLR